MAIKIEKGKIPIWEKYMLTVDEAVQYFGIGEKKIRMLISEHLNSECCFTVQVGCCYSAFYLVLNHPTFDQIKKRHGINYSDRFYIRLLYVVPFVLS